MTFDETTQLLKTNTSIKLIMAGNAPLIISFLFNTFKQNASSLQVDAIPEKELSDALTDTLYRLNEESETYPKQAIEYLTDWANAGFVRKYAGKTDDFIYELTPATETVFKWIDSLKKREFVGTESRLKNLFEKLQELAGKTQIDATGRLTKLEEQKRKLEQEIEDVKVGRFEVLNERQIKEQYYLIEDTAKSLLADFKQVEQNFRELDRAFRRKILTTAQVKGEVLADLFEEQDLLTETDQGKSFMAFWEFLLSQSKQIEFDKLIQAVLGIPVIQQIKSDTFRIDLLKNNLIEAGDRTNKTTNSLLDQLRKYLEHKSFFENKRILDNITEGLKIICEHPEIDFTKLPALELDDTIHIDLITERPLFKPTERIKFSNGKLEEGKAIGTNELLYDQFGINVDELKSNIRNALKDKVQISFPEFIRQCRIEKGVAEVVAYLDLATKGNKHLVDNEHYDMIFIRNAKTNQTFKVKIPQIIFKK